MIDKKRYNHGYEIYKHYQINDILTIIDSDKLPDKIIYHDRDYSDSLSRMKIIKQLIDRDGERCVCCGEVPSFFGLGKDRSGYWHLDLYSVKNNEPYMFTIDHIFPKSKGGKNEIPNYQLMCKVCNEDKSDTVVGEKKEVVTKQKKLFNYIGSKLTSLNQQTKGILFKIKNRELICVKEQDNFTIGNSYNILDIKVDVDYGFNSFYSFKTKGDDGDIIITTFDNFSTKNDSEYFINKKFNNYD